MLELAQRLDARILQASTSEVYGDPLEHPQQESYYGNVDPIGLRACYDEGKRAAETLFMDFYRMHDVDIRIVRIFNTYGPNMDSGDGRVVSNFIVNALKGDDLEVYGDGKQTRSFMYVNDLIEGMVKMMDQDDFIGPVNLGNPNEITVNELANEILSLTKSKSKIAYRDLPQGDPKKRKPAIQLAREKLGWQPSVNLKDGLTDTIRSFMSVS